MKSAGSTPVFARSSAVLSFRSEMGRTMEEVINKISLILRTAMQRIVFEPEVCFVE